MKRNICENPLACDSRRSFHVIARHCVQRTRIANVINTGNRSRKIQNIELLQNEGKVGFDIDNDP